ncbi:outer membrane lipoprotein-sorting protein [Microbulbifer rhizosphaerae]|uniref:Uncharacterized protein TP-0789 domain-containing protein n=1 Tax=Microbulbifer rhizosphaerae TaxID=1562603 RepID=A0A7W4ZB59_9GAMM|nr:outer membrane lipoprotein-sorting protein [Microbulbifer rhizosphaerae]MBB3061945.1 hypothetical protein [Microbulbifer rhizosphaerae]
MLPKKKYKLLNLFLLALALSTQAQSDPVQRGLEIARERKARDSGWVTSEVHYRMTLRNVAGDTSAREIVTRTLEVTGDGDKSLTLFKQPADVRGTAFLNYAHIDTPDDQWLFLPALQRVKRIASRNKSGPFMGSEFAYEDLSSFEVEKYVFRLVGEETFAGQRCFVVESIPNYEFSGYKRRVSWIDQSHYRLLKTEYYDRKDSLLKTLSLSDYQWHGEHFWRAHTLEMVNHQTGKSTQMLVQQLKLDAGLSERDFKKSALKRAH